VPGGKAETQNLELQQEVKKTDNFELSVHFWRLLYDNGSFRFGFCNIYARITDG
jgi:hypothetical protein